eukprot:g4677.t1
MGDRCRVYNMNALRELVVEAKVEEELERRKRVARKKSMAASAATGIGASALSLSGGNLSQATASIGQSMASRDSLATSSRRHERKLARERASREAARQALKHERFWEAQQARLRREERESRERVEAIAKKKDREFKYWMQRVADPQERALVSRVHKWLDMHEEEKRRKLRALHNEWETNVYNRVADDVASQMAKRDPVKTKQLIQREYQNYITLSNKKGAIFRDIYIESEYDPNVLNRNSIKVKIDKFEDPTERVLVKRREELGLMSRDAEEGGSGGRETLDVKDWLTGKIEATPHGFAAKFAKVKTRPSDSLAANLSKSTVVFDHFKIPKGEEGKRILDAELGPGKASVPGARPDHDIFHCLS